MTEVGPPDPAQRPGLVALLSRLAVDTRLLRTEPAFRRLWFGQGVSAIGNQITTVAIPFQVYRITHSTLAVGLLGAAALVPLLTASLYGGAVADAFDRRRLLIVTDIALALVSTGLLVNASLARPHLWALYVAELLGAATWGFSRPAMDALTPRLVGPDKVTEAMALQSVYSTLAHVAGPAAGGLLIAGIGLPGAYAVDIATFGASLVAACLLPSLPPLHDVERPGLAAIREGFRFVRGRPPLLGIFVVDTNAMIFGMPSALFPAYGAHFGGGARTVGFLYAAPFAGALLASLLSGWMRHVRRLGLAVSVAAAAWGAAIALFGLANGLVLGLVFLAVAGAADEISAVFRSTILLRSTPDSLRGRLSGIELAQVAGAPTLGNVEAGLVASLTSLRFSVVSGGLACVAGTLITVLAIPKFLRYDARAPE